MAVPPTPALMNAPAAAARHDDPALGALRALTRSARMLERSCGELSLAQYRVLAAIADGAEQASRIARRLALGKPAVSTLVETLCERGLLERHSVAGDQRAAALDLTERGRAVLQAAEEEMLAKLAAIAGKSGAGDALIAALAAMDRAIEALAGERLGSEQ
ncbi:MAG: MarR family winged helix-turn-helix transcriptional regulator [Actinomycetota bacterium]|nr:MarR family winged helix-turn-helix transcriptional regulator [Actinomycetota bacterium]